MPNIYTVASLLYQLYNMVTIFGLHNFRNLLRVIQVKRDIGKLRHQIAFAHEAHFSPHHGRSPIFGIKNRKSREISLAFIYLFAEITQSSFHIIYFLLRNLRIQSNNLDFYLHGNIRNTVGRQLIIKLTHLGRCGFYIFYQISLYFLYGSLITNNIRQLLTNFGYRLFKVFFHFFLRPDISDQIINTSLYLLKNSSIRNCNRIQFRLMQKKFLHGKLFGYYTIRIAIDTLSVVLHLSILLFNLRLINSFISYYPYNLIDNIVIGKSRQRHRHKEK